MSVPTVDELVEDQTAWPILLKLGDCLCQEIASAGLPPTCICSPMPGDAVAADYVTAEAGMSWVRVASVFPYTVFPAQETRALGCAVSMAVQLEVGTLFCAPVVEGRNGRRPPGLSAMYDSTRIQMAAMAAMLRAIECCLSGRSKDVALGAYTPLGPDGGVVGGSWTVTVAEGVH